MVQLKYRHGSVAKFTNEKALLKALGIILFAFGVAGTSSILFGAHLFCTGCVSLNINTSYGSVGITATGLTPNAEVELVALWSILGTLILVFALILFRKAIATVIKKFKWGQKNG